MMVAQFTGITLSLSIAGAIFVNEALSSLQDLLPMVSTADLSAILSGELASLVLYFSTGLRLTDVRSPVAGTSNTAIDAVPESLRGATIEIIVQSLGKVYIPAYVGAAIAFLLSFFLNVSLAAVVSESGADHLFFAGLQKKRAFHATDKSIPVTV